jgi:predicted transcriptional regulator
MTTTITVALPVDVQLALNEISAKEGISRDEVVGQAIKQHLFLKQFRLLRERMSAKAKDQGIITDQDVFDRVS